MVNLVLDIHEQILVRSDVINLIRFKSVCKSWQSLISSRHFIKAHLNHTNNNDRNSNEVGDRRISNIVLPTFYPPHQFLGIKLCSFVGSCNGLVCINSDAEILVANPSTRELKTLQKPPRQFFEESLCCWGFGYDSSTDDYKVVVGFREEDRTYFQLFSLKSNAWKVVGEVKYTSHRLIRKDGVFCNGAIHWVMLNATPQSNKAVILSFDLSLEEFKEILQLSDVRYVSDNAHGLILRLIEKSLCISLNNKIWKMSKCNLKQSWEIMGHDCLTVYGYVYSLTEVEKDIPYERSTTHRVWFFGNRKFIGAPKIGGPIIVQSLVSPHLHEKVAGNEWQESKVEPALADFLSVNDHDACFNP